ncbi:uncharacterized protein LOC132752135, partial [Ruditapes philippinarum]|uniref:uncharacterized protein LOC132752135 n=1 Tax=Ruditapes philippinarum TaxID=129788 RepID=UPI00295B7D80
MYPIATPTPGEIRLSEPSKLGHYRCSWHFGPAPSAVNFDNTTKSNEPKEAECSSADSSRITSYVNHCSKQNYVPLSACREDGTWNCQSFIAMCKTLIHTEPMAANSLPEHLSSSGTRAQIPAPSPVDIHK